MRMGRWCTATGSVALFVVGILHGLKFSQLETMISGSVVKPPLDGIVRGSWLIFSTEMIGLAIIAMVASTMQRGGRIVLLCGLVMAVNGLLLLKFVGPFVGVYITLFVMIMFLAGGFLLGKEHA